MRKKAGPGINSQPRPVFHPVSRTFYFLWLKRRLVARIVAIASREIPSSAAHMVRLVLSPVFTPEVSASEALLLEELLLEELLLEELLLEESDVELLELSPVVSESEEPVAGIATV